MPDSAATRYDRSALAILAGPTSAGLARPARGALNELVDVTAGFFSHG
jgi:hypothetical protein